jgi:hypothetical protein
MAELNIDKIIEAQNDAVQVMHRLIKLDTDKALSEDRARTVSAAYNASAFMLQIDTMPRNPFGAFPFPLPDPEPAEKA